MRVRPRSVARLPRREMQGQSAKRPAGALTSLLAILATALFLAGCGTSGPNPNSIPLPTVTISPTTASVATGGPLQFSVSVVSTTSTTITWSVNNILGGNSSVGTVSSAGLYVAPATVPSPATVTVKATSSAETNPYGSAIVTIMPPPVSPLTVSPADSSALAGSTVPFSAFIAGGGEPPVTWSVNGVAGGNSTVGTISSAGVYVAPAAPPSPATVVVTAATSQANPLAGGSTTLTVLASNSSPLFVNLGLNGNTGSPYTNYYNGLFTSVTICLPVTNQCQTIPNVLVDTGSVGLRMLNSALTSVPATELGTIRDSSGNQVEECAQFGDTSYAWGPVLVADVRVGGELASSVPIQVIGDTPFSVPSANCLSLGPGPSLDTVAALGANGILGVGTSVQDCGLNCAGGQTFSGYPYYVCPHNACTPVPVTVQQQVANPVAFFTKDNNGVEILLPSIAATGAPSLPYTTEEGTGLVPAGQLIFGIATESNNALGSATLYAADEQGNFSKVVYNGTAYTSGGYVDSGSNALFVSDPSTLGIVDCPDNPYYCPSTAYPLSLSVYGTNGTTGGVALTIANADTLIGSGNVAFNNLGGSSGTSALTDYFDLGLPFFFGRGVFVGIGGTTVPNNVSAPNGYFAF